jgi:hypothetical protein
MRLPHIRFTVRRMMIAVAVMALMFGAARLWQRRDFCLRRAALHARWEASRRADEWTLARNSLLIAANLAQADADEHARMKSIYERIALRLWETLPDDSFPEDPPDGNPFYLKSQ